MSSDRIANEVFTQAQRTFKSIMNRLQAPDTSQWTHAELEEQLLADGYELMRELFQSHLRLRFIQEVETRADVQRGSDGIERRPIEKSERGMMTVFGPVRVPRLCWGARKASRLHPSDARLNLPKEKASHGMRRIVAEEAIKTSFDHVIKTVHQRSGGQLGKKQSEQLVKNAAQDFDAFYQTQSTHSEATSEELLILSCDGKGITVLPRDLRAATHKAAEKAQSKLTGRLSPGEKKNRKRMAMVGAVYDIERFPRKAQDILSDLRPLKTVTKNRPRAKNKRIWASIEKEARDVIAELFDEAERRDPNKQRQWVALVDGAPYPIQCLEQEAERRGVPIHIVLDLIHVLEYLWKAAWCFFDSGSPEAQKWVTKQAQSILNGRSSQVAAGIRRSATLRCLKQRTGVDACCNYLIAKRAYLAYDCYLSAGYPVSTGVIEGACRHLINDRLGITGARWSVPGAEAVLKLRSLRSSDDFNAYWEFHLEQEYLRNHRLKYYDDPRREFKRAA